MPSSPKLQARVSVSLLRPGRCRDLQDATQKELRHAVKLLYSAAGIQHLSMTRPQLGQQAQGPGAGTPPGGQGQPAAPEFLTAAAVRLELRNDSTPHLGALKELVYVYREGALPCRSPGAAAGRLLWLLRGCQRPPGRRTGN